jgi:hypothetical protein
MNVACTPTSEHDSSESRLGCLLAVVSLASDDEQLCQSLYGAACTGVTENQRVTLVHVSNVH